jgi:hypothetical protein
MITFAAVQETDEWRQLALPAQEFYTDELAYHNWYHALDVAAAVVDLAARCEARGMRLNVGMLAVAAAWHDAGFQEDHKRWGYDTKEQYSAALLHDFLSRKKVEPIFVSHAQAAILGTTHKHERLTSDTLALHRADIANFGYNYDLFGRHTLNLLQEARRYDPTLTFELWKSRVNGLIEFVVQESIAELPNLGEPVQTAGSYDRIAAHNGTLFALESSESTMMTRIGFGNANTRY